MPIIKDCKLIYYIGYTLTKETKSCFIQYSTNCASCNVYKIVLSDDIINMASLQIYKTLMWDDYCFFNKTSKMQH